MSTTIVNATTEGGRTDVGGGPIWIGNLLFYLDAGNPFGGPQAGEGSSVINNIAPKRSANRFRQTSTLDNNAQVLNNYFNFDGVNDRIDMEAEFTMDSAGATLMWWMAPHSATTNYNIVGNGENGGVLQNIEFRQTFFYAETNNNCGYYHSPSFDQWNDNEWHHVAVTFNSNQEANWYIDGAAIGEATTYGQVNCTATTLSNLGGYDATMRYWGSGGYSSDYRGNLNQMMFYDTELTLFQISTNYRSQKYRYS